MKRRTRNQWYQYHLRKSQEAARSHVRSFHEPEIELAEAAYHKASRNLAESRATEPLISRMASWFGVVSDHRRDIIRPLEEAQSVANATLTAERSRQYDALMEASRQGEADYLRARAARKIESEARELRVASRRHEQRISYLERSPALRSAARFLKRILLGEATKDGSQVVCFYCQSSIPSQDSHLEHKRPISRGGDNGRTNLVLSCAPCNLRKGRKTHEEFLRELGGSSDPCS